MKRIIVHPYKKYELPAFVKGGNAVYIGHFTGSLDGKGRPLESFEDQARRTFKNLRAALKEINGDLSNLAKITVILRNISDFAKLHDIWKEVFIKGQNPLRTIITSDFVDRHCLIQIDGVALL